MMDSLSKCFNTRQERYESILEAKSIYRDDLEMTLPLNESEEVSVEPTKKYRCLQRAKRIDQSLRFEAGDEEDEQKKEPLQAKPRKVVRFQLENNKIIEPKKAVRFDLDHELEPTEKPLEQREGLNNKVEGKEQVVRVKIKMTKQEAQRLFSKRKNDSVLDLEHLVDQIANVSVHQLQVDMVMVGCNNERQGNGCWLSKLK